jgi:hypothetical protein
MPIVNTKLLLGWMEEQEAMVWLLNECRNKEPFTEESAKKLWNEYREKVAALPPRKCEPPRYLDDRNQKEEYAEHHFMQNFGKEPDIIRVVKIDDPGKMVAHQLSVMVPQSESYLSTMKDPKQRMRIALGRGMSFDGKLPKARKEGNLLIKPVPHAEFFVTSGNHEDFEVKESRRHIAVKEFDGRLMLSAGYHRSHMSMYRSKPEDTVLPLFAVLESDTVDGFFSEGSKVPFKRDMVRSSCPPLLSDFFDKSLCIELPMRKCDIELVVDLSTGRCGPRWIDATK